MKIYRLTFFLLLFLLIACNESGKDSMYMKTMESEKLSSVIKENYITINVGDSITDRPLVSHFYGDFDCDTSSYLLLDNNMIHFFDVSTGKRRNSISIATLLPERKGNFDNYSGFRYVNEDTLLLYDYATKEIFLSLLKSNNHKVWKIADLFNREYRFDPEAINNTLIYSQSDKIILSGGIFGPITTGQELVSGCIDMKNNSGSSLKNYPQCYIEGNFGGLYFNFVYHSGFKEKVLYSFPASYEVYYYDINNSSEGSFDAPSRYFSTIKTSKRNISELLKSKNERIRYYLTNPSFAQILYNPFRKEIYRIAEHPTEYMDNQLKFSKPFSIIVFDENYTCIGETEIFDEPFKYDRNNMHVHPEGLLIRNNDENDESIISFSLIEMDRP